MLNTIYFLLLVFPYSYWKFKNWNKFLQVLFLIINGISFAFELSDWIYFRYNLKRSTAGVFSMMGKKSDFLNLLPQFFIDFWFIPVIFIGFIFLLIQLNKRIIRLTAFITPLFHHKGLYIMIFVLVVATSIISIRGGFQYIPVNLRNGLQITQAEFVPIIMNTPFSLFSTIKEEPLTPYQFYSAERLSQLMPVIKNYKKDSTLRKNVVIIILESFSKEFTCLGGQKSFTPFLDQLMGKSLNCIQGYANGAHSAEALPAIISGIPSLMGEPFTTGPYGINKINSLPSLLGKNGYQSGFFHGGNNGTMSFDIFAAAAGFQNYFGRKEYNNDKDYDSYWGIRDEPFLKFTADKLNTFKQPFFATLFTLSAHHPYIIPDEYKEKLPTGPLPVMQAIAYTDEALKKFFIRASKQKWYSNTLFVLVADHASPIASIRIIPQALVKMLFLFYFMLQMMKN